MVSGPGLAVTPPSLSCTDVSWDNPLSATELAAAGCDDLGILLRARPP